jgi:hypothetical protein
MQQSSDTDPAVGQGSIALRQSGTGRRRNVRQPWHRRIGLALASDRARIFVLGLFMLLVALMGGGSRSDITSLVVLRPAAVLFAVYALFLVTGEQLREVRVPLLVVVATMLLALLQLIPLPAAIWTSLPNRETVAIIGTLLGADEPARPLSLDPDRTWNTFFALFVPFAAICLSAIQPPSGRRLIVPMLVGVGALSVVFGLLQAVGADRLLTYAVTNVGYPVGLFANRNHQSTMLLWLMLACSWLAASADPRRHSAGGAIGGALGAIVVLFTLMVLTGSRAGLLLSLPTLALCGWCLLRAPAMEKILGRSGPRRRLIVSAVVAIVLAPLLFVFGTLAVSGRDTALSRLFETDVADELRWAYLPIFRDMAVDFLPFGSGFGSFENVFNMYEPAGMLTSRYMNQAHNDPMQFIIEGGLPALAILLVALAWFASATWRVARARTTGRPQSALFFGGSIALWLAASLVDYPLRTPIAAMLLATLTAQLSFLSTGLRSGSGLHGKQDAPSGTL